MGTSLASKTARGGLQNEQDVADIFNNWSGASGAAASGMDRVVCNWLRILGHHDPARVTEIIAENPKDTHKRDVKLRVITGRKTPRASVYLISIKLLSSLKGSGTNHLQRLTIDSFVSLLGVPDDVADMLRLYTGETTPTGRTGLSDKRRVKANEFTEAERSRMVSWFSSNSQKILEQAFKGSEPMYAPGWILIVRKNRTPPDSVLQPMARAIQTFKEGGVRVERTSFRIGYIIIQRKGGGRGATDLQFKCPFGRLG